MSDDLSVDGARVVLAGADERLVDPGFLVNADPGEVLRLLDAASGPSARLAGAVYQASAHLHRGVTAGVRRQLLALDAARYGDRELAARIAAVPVGNEPAAQWAVEWATGTRLERRSQNILTGHTGQVRAVATSAVEGRPVVVTGSDDKTVRVWDLATGESLGEPFLHGSAVLAVAVGVVNGLPVAVTGSEDGVVRVWDVATGRPVGKPFTGHTSRVGAVTVLSGTPLAVTGSADDETVRVWDLATGEEIDRLFTDHDDWVRAVAVTVEDGWVLAVTGDDEGVARVWRVDMHNNWRQGQLLTRHGGPVRAVAVADGSSLAATGSRDGSIQVWDAVTGERVVEFLSGHPAGVLAMVEVNGKARVITGSRDGVVREWNLATGGPVGPELVFPSSVRAVAVAPDSRLVVGFGCEVAVLARR
ncbi:WD40 repeat domain-containing protein [Streptomyces atratus]|uniref:WD40 repeat domain-containing protein n=1 Tax=Streptomyces atratus TaxID=1893 RepID=UPI00368ED3DF